MERAGCPSKDPREEGPLRLPTARRVKHGKTNSSTRRDMIPVADEKVKHTTPRFLGFNFIFQMSYVGM
jgi:hypothetical protein